MLIVFLLAVHRVDRHRLHHRSIFSPIFEQLASIPSGRVSWSCVNLQMAFMTPPMAMSIFVLKGAAPKELGITMGDIIKGVLPFVAIVMIVLVILGVFPQLITWLPEMMVGKV
jgi:TRAP-type mannitol/chloroaromatic compound transport system permease large subunit